MKVKIAVLLAAATLPLSASVTLSTQFGQAADNNGVPVPDGTLWALVVDGNADLQFTGFGLNGVLPSTPGVADTYFTMGQSLAIGNLLNGNTIFAMGAFNGTDTGLAGLWAGVVTMNYGVNSLAAGLNYAFYWFPGATYNAASPTQMIANQVGGIHTGDADIFDAGMILPPDGSAVTAGAATVGDAGGKLSHDLFRATTVIPEPSVALLGALGVFGLLRRRRA